MVDFYSWPKKPWLYIIQACSCIFSFLAEMLLSVINRPPAYSGLLSTFSHFVLFTNGFAQQYPCSLFINIKVKCVRLVIKLSRKILDVRKRLYAPNMSFFQLYQLFTQHITSYIYYILNPLWLYKEIPTCWVNCRLQQSLKCYVTFSLIHCCLGLEDEVLVIWMFKKWYESTAFTFTLGLCLPRSYGKGWMARTELSKCRRV